MALRIRGANGAYAEVNDLNELQVALTRNQNTAGGALVFARNDLGNQMSGTPEVIDIGGNKNKHLKTVQDTLLFFDTFTGNTMNLNLWQAPGTTMTVAQSGGFLYLNSGAIVTAGTICQVNTYSWISLSGSSSTIFKFKAKLTGSKVANKVIEIGAFVAGGTAPAAAPTDGFGFRWTSAGTLVGFAINNSTETLTAAFAALPNDDVVHDFMIVHHKNAIQFYINDEMFKELEVLDTQRDSTLSNAVRIAARTYTDASTAPSTAPTVRLSLVEAFRSGGVNNVPVANQMGAIGAWANQGQSGFSTLGTQGNNVNSTSPTSAALSNTATDYATLGGRWQFAAVGGAATDYALFGYQVPAGSASVAAKKLYITGVKIDTVNTGAAVAGTATIMDWSLGVGATAVSLATADAASGTKAPRRMSLGVQAFIVADAIGKVAEPIVVKFSSPVVANPAEFVHIILQMPVATATASQVIRGTCLIEGYWE